MVGGDSRFDLCNGQFALYGIYKANIDCPPDRIETYVAVIGEVFDKFFLYDWVGQVIYYIFLREAVWNLERNSCEDATEIVVAQNVIVGY
jgi:hypothetical protein